MECEIFERGYNGMIKDGNGFIGEGGLYIYKFLLLLVLTLICLIWSHKRSLNIFVFCIICYIYRFVEQPVLNIKVLLDSIIKITDFQKRKFVEFAIWYDMIW